MADIKTFNGTRRAHRSLRGWTVSMRPVLDLLDSTSTNSHPSSIQADPGSLRETVLGCFEIGPPIVPQSDEAEPTWVEEQTPSFQHDKKTANLDKTGTNTKNTQPLFELLELSEALYRVDVSERSELVAEHLLVLSELVAHHRFVSNMEQWEPDFDLDSPGLFENNQVSAPSETDGLCSMLEGLQCFLCVADPESHESSLANAIVWRTGELCDALELFGPTLLTSGALLVNVAETLKIPNPRP